MSIDPIIEPIIEGRPTIRLVRDLPHPPERVWRAVTDPAELAQWFVGPVEWTPFEGETYEVMGATVTVTRVDPPRELAWSWGTERYRIALEPHGEGGCRLTFHHVFTEAYGPGEQHALGWQIYLGRLASLLDGHPVDELVAHEQGIPLAVDGRPAVRFIRRLAHPVERVWEAVTTTDGLAAWFPSTVEFEELRVGAPLRFVIGPDAAVDGSITELEPQRRFAFLWGSDPVRIDLLDAGEGITWLTFTHVLVEEGSDAIAKTAAGWHVCLAALVGRLEDPAAPAVEAGTRTPEWQQHYDAYVARGYPAGAEIPVG